MNNQTLIKEITKLTDEWRSLAGKDHCKDRDFHWYIETRWSYGYPPTYSVQHHGYLLHDIEIECSSYEEALLELKNRLTEEVEEYKKYMERYDTQS